MSQANNKTAEEKIKQAASGTNPAEAQEQLQKILRDVRTLTEEFCSEISPLIAGDEEEAPVIIPPLAALNAPTEIKVENIKERDRAKRDLEVRNSHKRKCSTRFLKIADDNFRIWCDIDPENRRKKLQSGDIGESVRLFSVWYLEKVTSEEATEEEKTQAKNAYEHLFQKKSESIDEFKIKYDLTKKMYTKTTGAEVAETTSAINILKGLNKGLYQDQKDKVKADEVDQAARKKMGEARLKLCGNPQTEKEIWARGREWEKVILAEAAKGKNKPGKKRNDHKEEKSDMKSFASNKGGAGGKHSPKGKKKGRKNSPKKGVKITQEMIDKFNPVTDPPSKYHKSGCNACDPPHNDHWRSHCPKVVRNGGHNPKDTKISRATLAGADYDDMIERVSQAILTRMTPSQAPMISRANPESSMSSPTITRLLNPEIIDRLEKAGYKRIMRMTLYSSPTLSTLDLNSILIDNCGNVHEIVTTLGARRIRANPNTETVDTMAGPFTPREVCDIPYLGSAIFGREGKYNVFSQHLLMENQNVWVEDIGNFEMNIHIIPLNVILKARWRNDIMVCQGNDFFEELRNIVHGDDISNRRRNAYLREHGIKPCERANQEVREWVSRASVPITSQGAGVHIIATRPSRLTVDQAALFSEIVSDESLHAPRDTQPELRYEWENFMFDNFSWEGFSLVMMGTGEVQWPYMSRKPVHVNPLEAGKQRKESIERANNELRVQGKMSDPKFVTDVEAKVREIEDAIMVYNNNIFGFILDYGGIDSEKKEKWLQHFRSEQADDLQKINERRRLTAAGDPPDARPAMKRSKISRAALFATPKLTEDNQFLIESGAIKEPMPELADFDEDAEASDEYISEPPPSNVIVSKHVVAAADELKRIQRNLGYPSTTQIIKSRQNGSINWKSELPNKLLRACDSLLGPNPSKLKGTHVHPKHIPTNAQKLLDPTKRQVIMQIDYLHDDKGLWIVSVIDPIGYTLVKKVSGRGTDEARKGLKEMIDFYREYDILVKVVQADSEGSFKKLEDEIKEWTDQGTFIPFPTGLHLGLIDSVIRRMKNKVRSWRAALNFIFIGGLILSGLYMSAATALNLLATAHNPGFQSPEAMLTGETRSIEKIFRHMPGDMTEASNEVLQANRTGVDRSLSMIALYPIKPTKYTHTWEYLNLDTMKTVPRNYGVTVPYTDDQINRITKLALDPASSIFCESAYKAMVKPKGRRGPARAPPRGQEVEPSDTAPDYAEPITMEVNVPAMRQPAAIPPTPAPAGGVATARGVGTRLPTASVRQVQMPATPWVTPEPRRIGDELEIEIAAAPDLMRVEADGSVAYSSYRHLPINTKEDKLYYKYIGRVKYSEIKGDNVLFASHMSTKKAIADYGDLAIQSLITEIDGFLEREVWQGILWSSLSNTQRKRILRSSTFLKEKFDLFGKLIKLKSRIVVDGSMEDRSLFKEADISSPTAALSSVLAVVTVAAAEDRKVLTLDIGQAYLNSNMPGDVMVRLEPIIAKLLCERDKSFKPYLDERGSMIVRLNKAQYGCVESARLWYNTLSAKLVSMGYEVNPYDPCVFNRIGTNGKQTTVVIYVDDILATSEENCDLEELAAAMEAEYKTISVKRGDIHEYLGMLFEFRKSGAKGKVFVSMEKYTIELLDDLCVFTTSDDPAASTLFDIRDDSPLLGETQRELFHRTVAQLLYLATRTRPDILLPVIFLTTRVNIATKDDQRKLNRVLTYLRGEPALGIHLGAAADGTLRLHCYADASFGVHPDGKSHSGIVLTLGSGPILAKSVKQKIVVKSSTESELVTLSDATSITAGLLNFLSSLGLQFSPAIMYQDNMSTMRLAHNGRSNSDRTKHIRLRYFFIKQYLDSGEFELVHCPTDIMIADILTKPLHGETFKRIRAMLLGYIDA